MVNELCHLFREDGNSDDNDDADYDDDDDDKEKGGGGRGGKGSGGRGGGGDEDKDEYGHFATCPLSRSVPPNEFPRSSFTDFSLKSFSYLRRSTSHNKKNIPHSLPRTRVKQISSHQIEARSSVGSFSRIWYLVNGFCYRFLIKMFLKIKHDFRRLGKLYNSCMCPIFGDVKRPDEAFQELLAFFKVSCLLVIDSSGAI